MVAATVAAACGRKETAAQMLSAHGWTLSEVVVEGSTFTETPPANVTVEFNDSTKMVAGRGGCNRFTAPYTLGQDGTMTIARAAATMMMCPDAEFENRYFDWLAAVARFEVSKEELRLVSTGATLVYKPEFVAVE
jgi:heat shock protein HslJ